MNKYPPRTPEQRAKRRIREQEQRAREREGQVGEEKPAESGEKDIGALEVEVALSQVAPASLKDRLFGKSPVASPPAPVKKGGRGGTNALIKSVLPPVVATFIATYSYTLVAEEYKPCTPTSDEVEAILSPLFAILARHVQIYGKVSQNVLDLITAGLAAIMYGTRAGRVYLDIKRKRGDHQEADHRIVRDRPGGPTAEEQKSAHGSHDGHTDAHQRNGENERPDALLASALLERDKHGRIALGLHA